MSSQVTTRRPWAQVNAVGQQLDTDDTRGTTCGKMTSERIRAVGAGGTSMSGEVSTNSGIQFFGEDMLLQKLPSYQPVYFVLVILS